MSTKKDFPFKTGEKFVWERHISQTDIDAFAKVVGDNNPLHLDKEFAEKTFFKKRIVHGAFLLGLISKILGVDFPGQGTVYISQNSSFRQPVYTDTAVKVVLEITEVLAEKRRLVLATNIFDEDEELCLKGEAIVWIPSTA